MRYSTDELVALLETVRIAPSKLSQRGADRINAIIARLRAADALLEAAKVLFNPQARDVVSLSEERIDNIGNLRKAIAAYEEERDGKV